MRSRRPFTWPILVMLTLTASSLAYFYFALDRQGQPYCHKQILMAFELWTDNHTTNEFPNVQGSSSKSLAQIRDELRAPKVEQTYKYVPGLHKDDPGDLVLMYLATPTRWTSHVQNPPNRLTAKEWILVPLDFKTFGGRSHVGVGECSERVPFNEFRTRLLHTLDFVRTNQRPNWRATVAEHIKFLDTFDPQPR